MVDRFFDGDKNNNIPTFAYKTDEGQSNKEKNYNLLHQELLKGIYDKTKKNIGSYWGGDLAGIIKKLDYLQDLGITQLVLTPIMQNAKGYVSSPNFNFSINKKNNSPQRHRMTSYHGYWIKDWFEIEDHFRDSSAKHSDRFKIFRTLLIEAKSRGIGVILDLTINHSSPISFQLLDRQKTETFNNDPTFFPDQGSIYKHGKKFSNFIELGINDGSYYLRRLNPENSFHDPADLNYDDLFPSKWLEENGMLPGWLPDIDQENRRMKKYLFDAVKFWLTFNSDNPDPSKRVTISGFRLDAVKHIPNHFWKEFEEYVLNINSEAIIFGEYFEGGWNNKESLEYLNEMEDQSMFDFDLSISIRRFFSKKRNWYGRTATLKAQINVEQQSLISTVFGEDGLDGYYNPTIFPNVTKEDASSWVTFLESHDLPRLKGHYEDMTDSAYKSALMFLLTSRGVPLLMYGTESALSLPYNKKLQGLFGTGGDPFNRPMMTFPSDPGFNNKIFNITKSLIKLRKAYPYLKNGPTKFLNLEGMSKSKDIAFVRKGTESSILYIYSTNGKKINFNIEAGTILEIINNDSSVTLTENRAEIEMAPEGGAIIVIKN